MVIGTHSPSAYYARPRIITRETRTRDCVYSNYCPLFTRLHAHRKMPVVLRAKCVIVGESTVGKTALVQSFSSDGTQYSKNYNMTTGVDISVKTVLIPGTKDTVELYMYDSSGKELYSDFLQHFWEEPGVVMVVYDVTSDQSFDSCAKWLERVKAQKPTPELPLPSVLVANKTDLNKRRLISEAQGRQFAASKELEYFECSAKDHDDVSKPFQHLAEQYYAIYKNTSDKLTA